MGLRIGAAFVLVGIIVLVVYLLGFSIGQGDPLLLLAGLMLSLLGLLLRRRSAARSKGTPNRFRTVRRLMGWDIEQED